MRQPWKKVRDLNQIKKIAFLISDVCNILIMAYLIVYLLIAPCSEKHSRC